MKCPYCNSSTKVVNSRSHNNNKSVWRRRECKKCHAVWTTDESISLRTTHKINKPGNHLEPFNRDILFVSILDSLSHRKDNVVAASGLTDTILTKILSQNLATIDINELRQLSFEILSRFDITASSIYKAKYF